MLFLGLYKFEVVFNDFNSCFIDDQSAQSNLFSGNKFLPNIDYSLHEDYRYRYSNEIFRALLKILEMHCYFLF